MFDVDMGIFGWTCGFSSSISLIEGAECNSLIWLNGRIGLGAANCCPGTGLLSIGPTGPASAATAFRRITMIRPIICDLRKIDLDSLDLKIGTISVNVTEGQFWNKSLNIPESHNGLFICGWWRLQVVIAWRGKIFNPI